MNKKNNNKGFTLAELLIVVAIIAVLVAIAIPVFSAQLEKSREATDMANIRSAYAEVVTKILDNPKENVNLSIDKKQTQSGWQTSGAATTKIAGVALNDLKSTDATQIVYTASDATLKIDGKEATTTFTAS